MTRENILKRSAEIKNVQIYDSNNFTKINISNVDRTRTVFERTDTR